MQKRKIAGRARLKDEDVFIPSADVPVEEVNRSFGQGIEREVYCYTLMGHHDYLDEYESPILMDTDEEEAEDRDIAFAKEVITEKSIRYYIKRGPNGRLFNPLGIMDEWTHNKIRHGTGKKQWGYHEVGFTAFDLYIKFLRTKNTAYHKNAEREAF